MTRDFSAAADRCDRLRLFADNTWRWDGLTKRAALKASRHKYVLMEHQKFDSNECYKYAKLDDIDAIITDEDPNPEIRELIESVGVDII